MDTSPLETIQGIERRIRRVCTIMVLECAKAGIDPNDPAAVWQWALTNWPGIKSYLTKQYGRLREVMKTAGPMA